MRRIEGPVEKGFHRIAWDLRYPAPEVIALGVETEEDEPPQGLMAAPGAYTATLYKRVDGQVSQLDEPIEFAVERLYQGALPGAPEAEVAAFWRAWEDAAREASKLALDLERAIARVGAMSEALSRSRADAGQLDGRLHQLRETVHDLDTELNGNPAKREVGEKTHPTVLERLFAVERTIYRSLYGPTETARQGLALANTSMESIRSRLDSAQAGMDELGEALVEAGAPYVEGVSLD